MTSLASGLRDSRYARFALGAISLAIVTVIARPDGRGPRTLVDAAERARARGLAAAWIEAGHVDHCPRPALREPALGDATQALRAILDDKSPIALCTTKVMSLSDELQPPCKARPCPYVPLGSLAPHPELAETCAPLHTLIERVAASTAACSPVDADSFGRNINIISLPRAVRLYIAPLVQRGELAAAARHVTSAMRLVDDLGRGGSLVGLMLDVGYIAALADTLAEILVDPRLSADDARMIATDLDRLRATAPPLELTVAQENAWIARQLTPTSGAAWPITGDPEQDVALQIFGVERTKQALERACDRVPLRTCAERLARWEPLEAGNNDELARELRSDDDDHVVRERIVAKLARSIMFWPDYARRLGYRDFVLRVVRMQAELRTMPADACRDPKRRRAQLAAWLADDLTVGDEAAPAIATPRWVRTRYTRAHPLRILRCVD